MMLSESKFAVSTTYIKETFYIAFILGPFMGEFPEELPKRIRLVDHEGPRGLGAELLGKNK